MSRIFAGLLTTFFALGVVFASPIRQSTSLANRGSGVATTVPEDRTQELKAPAKAKMAGIVYEVADWFESAANVVGDMFAMPPLIEGRSSMYPTPATYTYKGSVSSVYIYQNEFIALWYLLRRILGYRVHLKKRTPTLTRFP